MSAYPDRDWTCRNCNRSNFRRRSACRWCDWARPSTRDATFLSKARRVSDWTCHSCNSRNLSNRLACNQCHAARPPSSGVATKTGMRPGDWECPACKNNNFASRTVCNRCPTKRPQQAAPKAPVACPGDWLCPGCEFSNFGSRDMCMKCGNHRPRDDASAAGSATIECVVCMDAKANVTFGCGHLCCCLACADQVDDCPSCRVPITRRTKTFYG